MPALHLDLSWRVQLALYAAAATILFVLERLIPNPLPWLRLGLANTVTVVVLLRHGAKAALAVLALRTGLAAFFAGTFIGPQFILAAAGGAASLGVMVLASRLGGRIWSALGISILGAVAHALAQLAVVGVVFGVGAGVRSLLPVFLAISLCTGSVIGLLADALLARVPLVDRPVAAG